jgi:hypothetical protein
MKKTIASMLLIASTLYLNAQSTNDNEAQGQKAEYRLKTNPLSPMVAYEPNINLSLEYFKTGERNNSGAQISLAYIYDWKLLEKSKLNPKLNVSGMIATGEYRFYKDGFYFGPYVQYKTVSANQYARVNANNNVEKVDLFKRTLSGGFLGGYQFKVNNNLSSELQFNFGISNKQFYENNIPSDRFEDASDGSFLLIDQTGRVPQFLFTYKVIYCFRK